VPSNVNAPKGGHKPKKEFFICRIRGGGRQKQKKLKTENRRNAGIDKPKLNPWGAQTEEIAQKLIASPSSLSEHGRGEPAFIGAARKNLKRFKASRHGQVR